MFVFTTEGELEEEDVLMNILYMISTVMGGFFPPIGSDMYDDVGI